MRRLILAAGLALGFVIVGAPSCQPGVTITATPNDLTPGCGAVAYLTGTVTPATATPRVVLQRTVGGKWVDWEWYSDAIDNTKGRLGASVNQSTGAYSVAYWAPITAQTLHLRVRSNGGGAVSNGPYVTTVADSPGQCDP